MPLLPGATRKPQTKGLPERKGNQKLGPSARAKGQPKALGDSQEWMGDQKLKRSARAEGYRKAWADPKAGAEGGAGKFSI